MPEERCASEFEAELRPARNEDAQDLFGLLALCFAQYPGCYVDPHDDLADLRHPAETFAGGGGGLWVAADGRGRVCACVGLEVRPGSDAELHRLYVRPDARRSGLGRALVRFAEARAVENGAVRMVLWSDTRFADAHRLYTRLGYRETGARRDLSDISGSREACFERDLVPPSGADSGARSARSGP